MLNMIRVVQHIWEAIRHENTKRLEPVFDRDQPIRATGDKRTWFTGRPCAPTARSHINFCVSDGTREASDAFTLDHASEVDALVKNDHLGFEVFYVHRGVVRKCRPDSLIRLTSGDMLGLETKGQDTDRDRTKRMFLTEWVAAVSQHGGFGHWACGVSMAPGDIHSILARLLWSGVGHDRRAHDKTLGTVIGTIGPTRLSYSARQRPTNTLRGYAIFPGLEKTLLQPPVDHLSTGADGDQLSIGSG